MRISGWEKWRRVLKFRKWKTVGIERQNLTQIEWNLRWCTCLPGTMPALIWTVSGFFPLCPAYVE